jgi:hypothetical protein
LIAEWSSRKRKRKSVTAAPERKDMTNISSDKILTVLEERAKNSRIKNSDYSYIFAGKYF